MSSGFAALLPVGIAVREFAGVPDAEAWRTLPEPERSTAAAIVASRRAEFALGRQLARQALTELGLAPVPIPRKADRLPAWPDAVVGAITHCDGLVAVAVARRSEWQAIGIDAEVVARLDAEILEHIGTPAEQAVVAAGRPERVALEVAARFAAKECVQKAWGPVLGGILPFSAVEALQSVGEQVAGVLELAVRDPQLAARAGAVIAARWALDGPLIRVAIAAR